MDSKREAAEALRQSMVAATDALATQADAQGEAGDAPDSDLDS